MFSTLVLYTPSVNRKSPGTRSVPIFCRCWELLVTHMSDDKPAVLLIIVCCCHPDQHIGPLWKFRELSVYRKSPATRSFLTFFRCRNHFCILTNLSIDGGGCFNKILWEKRLLSTAPCLSITIFMKRTGILRLLSHSIFDQSGFFVRISEKFRYINGNPLLRIRSTSTLTYLKPTM